MADTRLLLPLSVLCGLCGLYGWAVFAMAFRHDGVIGPPFNAPGTDFMVYHSAARLWLAGKMPLVLDGDGFTALLNERFAFLLRGPLPLHPLVYPPLYLF